MVKEREEGSPPLGEEAEDQTLAAYQARHQRPPAFEGSDGQPYTVSLELEKTGNLRAPYGAYLVFPRWAETGVGIVGHVLTPLLAEGRTEEEVVEALGRIPLLRVKQLLDEAIAEQVSGEHE